MPNLKIQVYLCPNELYELAAPDATWPTPQGVKIRLTDKAGAAARPQAVDFPLTNDQGLTSNRSVPKAEYLVEVLDDTCTAWSTWTVYPDTIDTTAGAGQEEIRLIPPARGWLLPVRVQRPDRNGNQTALAAAEVEVAGPGNTLESRGDGYVYATVPRGDVTLEFKDKNLKGVGLFRPPYKRVEFAVPESAQVDVAEFLYMEATPAVAMPTAMISVEPTVLLPSGQPGPLTGASATIEYTSPASGGLESLTRLLAQDEEEIRFDNLAPGAYTISVGPPAAFDGWPLDQKVTSFGPVFVSDRAPFSKTVRFGFKELTISGRVQTTDGRLVPQDLQLEIFGPRAPIALVAKDGEFELPLSCGGQLTMGLGLNPEPKINGIPLEPVSARQDVLLPPAMNIVTLQYKYGVTGQAVDAEGNAVSGAVIDVFDERQLLVASVASGDGGRFTVGTKASGNYFVSPHTADGDPVTRQPVVVASMGDVGQVRIVSPRNGSTPSGFVPSGSAPSGQAGPGPSQPPTGQPPGQHNGRVREALTDLAAYPVLTEEISTSGGPPAPGATASGGGGVAAPYGQIVDQAMRDVLGWRPSGDAAGFQAALTGAFELREVEGHREWTWQQRGYAVQADMGALTGAQASIYARAKNALDQIQPLLAGVTALNPTIYPPQDLEAIRTVISAELQELVNELAWPAGPRIQRVNELFTLLVGQSRKPADPNPDHVQGQLGIMRDRFGLTVDWVDTVEEEFILTNFRVVVEQVLSLQESWFYDRGLLSKQDPNTSFGTLLIWLSRGLEAVCESVDDLTFALDSVYVDAAQRQVIDLKLPGHDDALLLSDLLEWITRAGRDEGPKLIQDAGKDGVLAFAPVLRQLSDLTDATRALVRGPQGKPLPDGLRTPRVDRAFQVLVAQLDEAARLAGLVRRNDVPQITVAVAGPPSEDGFITVTLGGVNFRRHALAVLIAENRDDLPELPALHTTVINPSSATVTFRDPGRVPGAHGVTWQVMLTNEDGQRSNQAAI